MIRLISSIWSSFSFLSHPVSCWRLINNRFNILANLTLHFSLYLPQTIALFRSIWRSFIMIEYDISKNIDSWSISSALSFVFDPVLVSLTFRDTLCLFPCWLEENCMYELTLNDDQTLSELFRSSGRVLCWTLSALKSDIRKGYPLEDDMVLTLFHIMRLFSFTMLQRIHDRCYLPLVIMTIYYPYKTPQLFYFLFVHFCFTSTLLAIANVRMGEGLYKHDCEIEIE